MAMVTEAQGAGMAAVGNEGSERVAEGIERVRSWDSVSHPVEQRTDWH